MSRSGFGPEYSFSGVLYPVLVQIRLIDSCVLGAAGDIVRWHIDGAMFRNGKFRYYEFLRAELNESQEFPSSEKIRSMLSTVNLYVRRKCACVIDHDESVV